MSQGLTCSQQRAVEATEGRILVLAGAGSGKTRVIVHRIAHLIEKCCVPPQEILGLTFTNKAAAEMRRRVTKEIGPEKAKGVTLSTFHSFCMQVLRKEIEALGYTKEFSLYDEKDLERLIQRLSREILDVQKEEDLPPLAEVRLAFAQATQEGWTEEEAREKAWPSPLAKELYLRLQSTLRAYNAVDFDHLIHLTIRLFEQDKTVLQRYQKQFRYLMIDEYQDVNPSQFRLAELLAKKSRNLCVVGDDDQSIYGWRGAKVNHILHFRADEVIKLEQNFRSHSAILDVANALIRHNTQRHEKKLWSAESPTAPVEIFNSATEIEEAQAVVDRIIALRQKKNLLWRDMAILYRSNVLSRPFELALINAPWQNKGTWVRGIPYEIFGGLEFFERSEIKDALAYLRIIANAQDEEALLRILNVPRRGISDSFLDELTQKNRSEKIPLWTVLKKIAAGEIACLNHPRGVAGIRSFIDLIEKAKKRFAADPLEEAFLWFLEEVQYKKAIEEEVKSDAMRALKWENIQECASALAQFESEGREEGGRGALQDFIANSALQKPTFASCDKAAREDTLKLMTFHSAKGLEFPACFLVGLEDHLLPHEKSESIEEERRLLYVGITRAMSYLTFSMSRSRTRRGKAVPSTPSRFLFEIPKTLLHVTTPAAQIHG